MTACEKHVAAINKGITGVPHEDRVRLHVCYGNWEGPHIHDVPLATILPALYQANVGALTIESTRVTPTSMRRSKKCPCPRT